MHSIVSALLLSRKLFFKLDFLDISPCHMNNWMYVSCKIPWFFDHNNGTNLSWYGNPRFFFRIYLLSFFFFNFRNLKLNIKPVLVLVRRNAHIYRGWRSVVSLKKVKFHSVVVCVIRRFCSLCNRRLWGECRSMWVWPGGTIKFVLVNKLI